MTPTELFVALHAGLPRQAPGSDQTTRVLADLAGPLGDQPRVLDIGCGPGRATLALASHFGARVTAVDLHQPYLDELDERAAQADLAALITTVRASMHDLPFTDASFDLVWAEGSAYVMGFDAALAAWRRLLAPDGALVLTECEWSTSSPHPSARDFWRAYPAMRTTADNVAAAMAAGWTVQAVYVLPGSDWDEYYGPLEATIASFERDVDDVDLRHVLDTSRREIEVRRAHHSDYSYTGYVLRCSGERSSMQSSVGDADRPSGPLN